MQPAQEEVSCPQVSTAPLPSLVPTGHPPACPESSQQMEPAQLWASPAQAAWPHCCPVEFHSSVWGALQEAQSWHNTGLKLTLLHENKVNELKSPCFSQPSQRLAHRAEPAWLGQTKGHKHSHSAVPELQLKLHHCSPLFWDGRFHTHTGMGLTLEWGAGVRLLCLPIWAVWNPVLQHWGVIPSQCCCLAAQGEQCMQNAPRRAASAELPGAQLCTISSPGNTNTRWYWWVVVCFCCLVSFFSGWSNTRKNFN